MQGIYAVLGLVLLKQSPGWGLYATDSWRYFWEENHVREGAWEAGCPVGDSAGRAVAVAVM